MYIGEGLRPQTYTLFTQGTTEFDEQIVTEIPYAALPIGDFTVKLEVESNDGFIVRDYFPHECVNDFCGRIDEPLPTGDFDEVVATPGSFQVNATIGGENFVSYSIYLGEGAEPEELVLYAEGLDPLENELAVEIPFAILPPGESTLRLETLASNGIEIVDTITLSCVSPLCGVPPVAAIHNIHDLPFDIEIVASTGGGDFASYELLMGIGSTPAIFETIAKGTNVLDNEVLLSRSRDELPKGTIVFRLTTKTHSGYTVSSETFYNCSLPDCGASYQPSPLTRQPIVAVAPFGALGISEVTVSPVADGWQYLLQTSNNLDS